MLRELNLPQYKFRFREENSKKQIFDTFRKKFIALTPEEWVRQNFLQYLYQEKKFPLGKIAIEKEININGLKRRYDALIFDKNFNAQFIIECKAPHIKIDEMVFEQIIAYNYKIKAPFLLLTNGLSHFCIKVDTLNKTHRFLKEIPNYSEINC